MSRPVVQGTANVVREDGTVNSGDDNEEELLCRLLTERIDFQNRIMEQQRTIAELRQVIQDHSRNTPDGGAVENGHAVRFCLHCMKSFSPEEEMASSTKVGSSVRHMDDEEEDTENKTSDCTANGETATVAELVKKVQTLQGWNEELIKTVEELRLALVENDTNAKTNSVYLPPR
ncbi:hypothetical protein ADEAN_000321700 [Angomonas deanei]|uniref:Uncharacterized protein n=1 Tax=Angomonas deanei TaxID=59799 RepID=A0A7G2C854_9TRYP|nr:hypothetical protein ADEAN_000321700 [Angomonas deanei]